MYRPTLAERQAETEQEKLDERFLDDFEDDESERKPTNHGTALAPGACSMKKNLSTATTSKMTGACPSITTTSSLPRPKRQRMTDPTGVGGPITGTPTQSQMTLSS
jgi:hypothetical protein